MSRSIIKLSYRKKEQFYIPIFIIAYFTINVFFLTEFPFVHSDESWLSGLSRHMLNIGSFNTSEPFFIEYPRAIHGLRLVFVSIQMIFMRLFNYSIFSMRLISLLASTMTLWMVSKLLQQLKYNPLAQVISLLLMAVNIQFIYASHMARQESLILLIMVIVFTLNYKKTQSILTGSLIGFSIGIHPNSFLIAIGIGFLYLYKIIIKETSVKELVKLIVVTAIGALAFISVSLTINPSFFSDYMKFGESLGVVNFDITRLEGFFIYYYKLYHQIGGTYLLLPIKLDLLFLSLTSLVGLLTFKNKDTSKIFMMIIGINLGYFIIGRYNQTAIVFTLFFNLLYWIVLIKPLKLSRYIFVVFFLSFFVITCHSITLDHENYKSLEEHFQLEGKVLGNLNMAYHLEDEQLIDYRNLWFVTDFEAYVVEHNIKYIVLAEEMSYIKKTSPKWDILYGSLPYYDNMITYLENCFLIDEFESPTYGMRIARYIDTYPWTIKIYEVPD